ncbi:hypothetical protein EDB84DRAFT_1499236, partial [Lactarius hengduanensis]
ERTRRHVLVPLFVLPSVLPSSQLVQGTRTLLFHILSREAIFKYTSPIPLSTKRSIGHMPRITKEPTWTLGDGGVVQ